MDLNEIIRILSDIRSKYNCFDAEDEECYRGLSEAIKMLSAQQWIPGKPKESGMYLVTGKEHFVPDHVDEPSTRDGAVGIAAYSKKWGWLDVKIHPVKAYMPLPKPYVPRRRKRNERA